MSTVDVKIYDGKYIPCIACKYFSSCVVPKPQHYKSIRNTRTRIIYRCEDFTSRNTTKEKGE